MKDKNGDDNKMDKVLITSQYLKNIADAIRNKNGQNTLYTPPPKWQEL